LLVIQVQFIHGELSTQKKAEKHPAKQTTEDITLLINPASTKNEPLQDEGVEENSEQHFSLN